MSIPAWLLIIVAQPESNRIRQNYIGFVNALIIKGLSVVTPHGATFRHLMVSWSIPSGHPWWIPVVGQWVRKPVQRSPVHRTNMVLEKRRHFPHIERNVIPGERIGLCTPFVIRRGRAHAHCPACLHNTCTHTYTHTHVHTHRLKEAACRGEATYA